jgi:hypothetical protein
MQVVPGYRSLNSKKIGLVQVHQLGQFFWGKNEFRLPIYRPFTVGTAEVKKSRVYCG